MRDHAREAILKLLLEFRKQRGEKQNEFVNYHILTHYSVNIKNFLQSPDASEDCGGELDEKEKEALECISNNTKSLIQKL